MAARKNTGRESSRPTKEVNWVLVDNMLAAGCMGVEISAELGMHHDTFYRKVEEEKGVGFTVYQSQMSSKGEGLLKAAQFAKAIGRTKSGDTQLLMFLGKVRLKQREHEENVTSPLDANLNFADAYIKSEQERMKMAEELQAIREELNALKPKTDPVIQRSDEEIQHMGGSSQIGQDLFEHSEVNQHH